MMLQRAFCPSGPGGEGPKMPHDLKRLFPIKDLPSARLMKLKAHCLTRAGVLSDQERAMVERKAESFLQ